MRKIITQISVLVLLTGCGAPLINPNSLRPVPQPAPQIVFEREFRYDISQEFDLPRPQPGAFRGLLKGTYTAIYEDDHGVYYGNDGLCAITSSEPSRGTKGVEWGGIWIEKNAVQPKFRIFSIAWYAGVPVPIHTEPECGSLALPKPIVSTVSKDDRVAGAVEGVAAAGNANTRANGAVASITVLRLIDAMAAAEKGQLKLLPAPVGNPSLVGKFTTVVPAK